MTDVFKIAEILVTHAKKVHGDEIGIIAYYGSHAKGTATPTSDLDIYYVPDDGKGGSLSTTFIIDDLPYDFWGPPWRLLEEIANARSRRPWAVSASMIADTKILYFRSQADLDRFNGLKDRIQALVQPENRDYMVERALEEFRTTLFQLSQMRLSIMNDDVPGLHWAGWKFMGSAMNCLALVNQTYFSKGWGGNTEQILQMAKKPDELDSMLNGILQPGEPPETLSHAQRLADEVRAILLKAQRSLAKQSKPKDEFKDFYYFIHEYKNKIYNACQKADALSASSAAFQLQELVCILMNKVDVGFYGQDFNILSEYVSGYQKAGFPDLLEPSSMGDLQTLAKRVDELDIKIKAWFSLHTIDLNILKNEGDLRRFLYRRDPLTEKWQKTDVGKIVGVVNIEHSDKKHSGWGEVFIQHHPDYDKLLPDMLEYAETYLFDSKKKQVFIPIYNYDDALIVSVQERGYQKNNRYMLWDSVYKVTHSIPMPTLPDGYSMHSMVEEGSDIDKRRKAFGVSFNHPEPMEWPSWISYQGLQQAPNYDQIWISASSLQVESMSRSALFVDEVNQIASLELVGTPPKYRCKGLARAAVHEAVRRVVELGARPIFVGSDQILYLAIGFDRALPAHHCVKTIETLESRLK